MGWRLPKNVRVVTSTQRRVAVAVVRFMANGAMQMKRSLWIVAVYALSSFLAGCGSRELSCDGGDTTDEVVKFTRKKH